MRNQKRLLQLLRDNAQRPPQGLRMEQAAEGDAATLYLYDIIDPWWGVSAAEVVKQLAGLAGQAVNLRINSPGGDVFEARAMAAAIAQHGNVTAWVDGIAASAATYVATAAKEVRAADGAFWMIHQAWALAYGNKDDLIDLADLLDKVDGTIVQDYARKTGKSAEQLAAWMQAETWFTAAEAQAAGFVDQIVAGGAEDKTAQAGAWNLSAFEHAPAALLQPAEPDPEPYRARAERRLRLLQPIA